MRIALLLFGQLRWVDNSHTAASHHEHIINRYPDVDVFGHFWQPETAAQLSQSVHSGRPTSPSDPAAVQKIQQQYQFTQVEFTEPLQFRREEAQLLQRCQLHDWPLMWQSGWMQAPNAFHNVLCQLYCIQRAARMLASHAAQYDLVVLSRPDICVWSYPDLSLLDPDRFYLSNHHQKFPDLSFVFGSKFLPVFSNVFSNTVTISDSELYSLWEPNAEGLKFNSYRKQFALELLHPVSLPVRIVRGQDCRGPQW